MAELHIDLVTPTGMVLEGTVLPDDMLTEEVIAELVDELNLPRLSPSGEPIEYALEAGAQSARLAVGRPLRDSGIANGDRLRLTSSKPLPAAPAASAPRAGVLAEPAQEPGGGNGAGTLEVVLSVLDVNKTERATLDATRPVAALVQQIAANFGLPARDKLNEPITYRVESKALGRYLANRETLAQAGVPRLDRLSIHREEHAG